MPLGVRMDGGEGADAARGRCCVNLSDGFSFFALLPPLFPRVSKLGLLRVALAASRGAAFNTVHGAVVERGHRRHAAFGLRGIKREDFVSSLCRYR